MSHFTVLVAAKSETELSNLMQPFHEFECTGIKDKYVEFVLADMAECKAKYEQQKEDYPTFGEFIVMVRHMLHTFSFRRSALERLSRTLSVPSRLQRRALEPGGTVQHVIDHYTFGEFMDDWYGYEQRAGSWGRWTNPNNKWDWWAIGGRWTGLLKLASTEAFELAGNGKPGLMTSPNTDPFAADFAPAGLVDWEAMREGDDPQTALTFAFIDTDGKWRQRGEMGWWASVDESQSTPDYNSTWWNFVGSLAADQMVYVIDCHI